MPTLFIHPKKGDSYSLQMPETEISIGRSSKNKVALSDPCCSTFHASLSPATDGFLIKDLGSKNGTFVNGGKIAGEARVFRGDEIKVGDTVIMFDRDDFTHSSKTVIKVSDILEKHSTGKSGRIPGIPAAKDESGQELKELDIVDEANKFFTYDQPLEKYLDHIMDVIIRFIPMDRGILRLHERFEEKLGKKEIVKISRQSPQGRDFLISESVVRTAFEKNEAILISNILSGDISPPSESAVDLKIHSAMCVPLWDEKEIIGVIYADRISVSGPFSKADLRDLTLLANLAANKIKDMERREIERAKKDLEKQRDLAEEIWLNLLPKEDPVFEPFEISGSARACNHIGGDYFNFISIGPSRMAFVIGDVSGTGVGAALIMMHLSGFLLPEIRESDDLTEITARLNDHIFKISDPHIFISFFIGIVDKEKGEMSYVNAGHNPPLLVNSKGGIQRLDGTGLCLGMLPSMKYGTGTVALNPGDLLCLYTDGVVEAQNKDREQFGDSRLEALLKKSAALPARNILDKIYDTVSGFTKLPKPEDDLTLVVLKR